MSRSLGITCCDFCTGSVELEEAARPITPEETGPYWGSYERLLVANAHCSQCGTKYLAWVDSSAAAYALKYRERWPRIVQRAEEGSFFDLSYRSTFNDEPGEADFVLSPWARSQLERGWRAVERLRNLMESLREYENGG